MKSIRCVTCGQEISPDMKFCQYCGTPVQKSIQAEQQASYQQIPPGYMRCPTCGSIVKADNQFCTGCGAPLKSPLGQKQGQQPPKKKKPIKKIIAISVLAAAVLFIVPLLYDANIGTKEPNTDTMSASEQEVSAAETPKSSQNKTQAAPKLNIKKDKPKEKPQEAAPEQEIDTQESHKEKRSEKEPKKIQEKEPEPAPIKDETPAVIDTICGYLDAFIHDVNAGSYNRMNSYVEGGSEVESQQINLINSQTSHKELLNFEIISCERQSDSVYHAVVIEEYDVTSTETNTGYYLKQKCIYQVHQQSDGTWKLADFVEDIDVLEKTEYEF